MAEYETKDKEEKEEAKRRRKAKPVPVYDQLKDATTPEDSRASQADAVLGLQQTHGNKYVQRLAEGDSKAALDEDIVRRIEAQRGSGMPLEPEVRTEMEAAFAHDFSEVRVFTNSEANKLSQELGAKAFTTGRDVFFKQGAYQPYSEAGKGLLGHELTHVIQQSEAPSVVSPRITEPGQETEIQAKIVAEAFTNCKDIPREIQTQSMNVVARQAEAGVTPPEAAVEEIENIRTLWNDGVVIGVEEVEFRLKEVEARAMVGGERPTLSIPLEATRILMECHHTVLVVGGNIVTLIQSYLRPDDVLAPLMETVLEPSSRLEERLAKGLPSFDDWKNLQKDLVETRRRMDYVTNFILQRAEARRERLP